MDEVARELVPERLVLIHDSELESYQVEEEGLRVPQWILQPFMWAFLHVLRAWEKTGAPQHMEAVEDAARTLLAAWVTAIDNARLLDRFPELGVARWEEESFDGYVAARRELVLQGHVIDSGRRRKGQIVWVSSSVYQQHGMWDA